MCAACLLGVIELCFHVQGQCQCDSSPETGFWYGDYCNQENECELDMHCGRGGVCQDSEVGAISPFT